MGTSSSPLFVFLKSFILGKSKWSAAWFHYISIALKLTYNRNKLFKTLNYWSRDMLNFAILDKGLGIVPAEHFVYDFSTKMFIKLYSINWPNFIFWLPLLLGILSNMCIAIVCQPGCDIIDFKTNLIFLIKLFLYMTKKVKTKTWISWERKELLRWSKNHFSSFLKGFLLAKIVSDLRVRL